MIRILPSPRLLALVLFTGCLSGCVQMPNLLHPGHISAQRSRMETFDPFARSEIGPKIPGDRPSGSTAATPLPQHLAQYQRR